MTVLSEELSSSQSAHQATIREHELYVDTLKDEVDATSKKHDMLIESHRIELEGLEKEAEQEVVRLQAIHSKILEEERMVIVEKEDKLNQDHLFEIDSLKKAHQKAMANLEQDFIDHKINETLKTDVEPILSQEIVPNSLSAGLLTSSIIKKEEDNEGEIELKITPSFKEEEDDGGDDGEGGEGAKLTENLSIKELKECHELELETLRDELEEANEASLVELRDHFQTLVDEEHRQYFESIEKINESHEQVLDAVKVQYNEQTKLMKQTEEKYEESLLLVKTEYEKQRQDMVNNHEEECKKLHENIITLSEEISNSMSDHQATIRKHELEMNLLRNEIDISSNTIELEEEEEEEEEETKEVEFMATLSDMNLEDFDQQAQDSFIQASVQYLGISLNQFEITTISAGSVLVTAIISQLNKSHAKHVSELIADSDMFGDVITSVGLGDCSVVKTVSNKNKQQRADIFAAHEEKVEKLQENMTALSEELSSSQSAHQATIREHELHVDSLRDEAIKKHAELVEAHRVELELMEKEWQTKLEELNIQNNQLKNEENMNQDRNIYILKEDHLNEMNQQSELNKETNQNIFNDYETKIHKLESSLLTYEMEREEYDSKQIVTCNELEKIVLCLSDKVVNCNELFQSIISEIKEINSINNNNEEAEENDDDEERTHNNNNNNNHKDGDDGINKNKMTEETLCIDKSFQPLGKLILKEISQLTRIQKTCKQNNHYIKRIISSFKQSDQEGIILRSKLLEARTANDENETKSKLLLSQIEDKSQLLMIKNEKIDENNNIILTLKNTIIEMEDKQRDIQSQSLIDTKVIDRLLNENNEMKINYEDKILVLNNDLSKTLEQTHKYKDLYHLEKARVVEFENLFKTSEFKEEANKISALRTIDMSPSRHSHINKEISSSSPNCSLSSLSPPRMKTIRNLGSSNKESLNSSTKNTMEQQELKLKSSNEKEGSDTSEDNEEGDQFDDALDELLQLRMMLGNKPIHSLKSPKRNHKNDVNENSPSEIENQNDEKDKGEDEEEEDDSDDGGEDEDGDEDVGAIITAAREALIEAAIERDMIAEKSENIHHEQMILNEQLTNERNEARDRLMKLKRELDFFFMAVLIGSLLLFLLTTSFHFRNTILSYFGFEFEIASFGDLIKILFQIFIKDNGN